MKQFYSRGFSSIFASIFILFIGIGSIIFFNKYIPYKISMEKQKDIINKKYEKKRTKLEIGTIEIALQIYKIDNGMYPTTEQGLQALITKPTIEPIPIKWRGPYLKSDINFKDKTEDSEDSFIYRSPGRAKGYDLFLLKKPPKKPKK
mgnify:CR=1 FL=1